MPAVTATVTTTEEVKLEPKLRQKLIRKLAEYARLANQIKALDEAKKTLVGELEDLRSETGEGSLKLEGHGTITLVAPTYKKFNEKKFVSLGGDLKIYQQAVEDHPKKAYTKITLPGSKDDE